MTGRSGCAQSAAPGWFGLLQTSAMRHQCGAGASAAAQLLNTLMQQPAMPVHVLAWRRMLVGVLVVWLLLLLLQSLLLRLLCRCWRTLALCCFCWPCCSSCSSQQL